VEGVEHRRELVEQRASAAAAGARRKLGRERGLAHVAQRADAAGDRGLFDVAPLLGGPDGRLPDDTAGRHAAVVVRCPSSAARSQPAGVRPRAQRANLGASPRCWLRKFRSLQSRPEGRYRDLRRTVLRRNSGFCACNNEDRPKHWTHGLRVHIVGVSGSQYPRLFTTATALIRRASGSAWPACRGVRPCRLRSARPLIFGTSWRKRSRLMRPGFTCFIARQQARPRRAAGWP